MGDNTGYEPPIRRQQHDRVDGQGTRFMKTFTHANPWVIQSRPKPQALVRLFCFPFAGGGASLYHAWHRDLPEQIAMYAVQLPGRENRSAEPLRTDLLALTDELSLALIPYMDRPCAFFGHSMGAVVAFELARRLRARRGPLPVHLFVSGRGAPQIKPQSADIHHLPDADFVREVRNLKGTPAAVFESAELMELALPVLRADFIAHETYSYRPEAPLLCPITAIGGEEDDEVCADELVAWREQTCGPFALRFMPGDHFYVQSAHEQVTSLIAEKLTQKRYL